MRVSAERRRPESPAGDHRSRCPIRRPRGYGPAMPSGADEEVLAVMDDDGEEVALDAAEADALFALTGGLEAATVSACPDCRSRVRRLRRARSTCSTPRRRSRLPPT